MRDVPPLHEIPVMILCGGKGIRIRDVSDLLPKPMLRIGDRPILWHIMKLYAHFGFRRFVLCLGYQGEQIKQYFLNYLTMASSITLEFSGDTSPPRVAHHSNSEAALDWVVTMAETGVETMTGGRVARAIEYFEGDLFMLTYGDGVGDVAVKALLDHHVNSGSAITVTGVHPPSRFGLLAFEGARAVDFLEKPQSESGYISGGFMVVNREFVDRYLTADESCVLEKDGLPRAARDGVMGVYCHNGFWMPMDNHGEYHALNQMWQSGKAPWKLW